MRRSGGSPKCPDISVKECNKVPYSQERFLSNEFNKAQLISLLSRKLQQDGQVVLNCKGDADTKIVLTALNLAEKHQDVIVVADDTDIAVMLIYHWRESHGNIIFYQQRLDKAWRVTESCKAIGSLREHVLFAHAFSGCDTTSAPFGKGKAMVWNTLKKSEKFREVSDIMNDVWAEQEQVGLASISAFITIYGGNNVDHLNKLRFVL